MTYVVTGVCAGCKCGSCAEMCPVKAFHESDVKTISLNEFKGKWVVLFFYPADFTFVCPTELGELADNYETLKELNTEVISVSTDTEFVHKAWYDNSDTIKKIKFPMLADPTGKVCRAYGTYIEEEGLSLRGTFIIDPDGIVRYMLVSSGSVGRSISETLRVLQAIQSGNLCPIDWEPGSEALGKA